VVRAEHTSYYESFFVSDFPDHCMAAREAARGWIKRHGGPELVISHEITSQPPRRVEVWEVLTRDGKTLYRVKVRCRTMVAEVIVTAHTPSQQRLKALLEKARRCKVPHPALVEMNRRDAL